MTKYKELIKPEKISSCNIILKDIAEKEIKEHPIINKKKEIEISNLKYLLYREGARN